jgi:hypothetical protein
VADLPASIIMPFRPMMKRASSDCSKKRRYASRSPCSAFVSRVSSDLAFASECLPMMVHLTRGAVLLSGCRFSTVSTNHSLSAASGYDSTTTEAARHMGNFSHRRREEVVGNRRDLFYPVSLGCNRPSSEASPQNAVGSNTYASLPISCGPRVASCPS